ncbi:alpha-1,6-glucosidase domain-containing protein [Massilia sp. Bi118]|uniref:alpha-1,6-glucosidase domain-containing protein n=1 Tax=Massilia sp. Bi118 TaxID=2822346 RepID=UPI0027D99973|nr:alpha-1,6-glucosidase domain-containing protein [Massilia sp. Bi118]
MPSPRASPTTTPASTCCARSPWTATASIRATGSTASTGPTRTTTSVPACRRRKTTARTTLIKPLLANPAFKPAPADIAFARDAFRDLLAIRASSTLFRMPSAAEIRRRLRFFNTGSTQNPTVVAAALNGEGYPGAGFKSISYFINVDKIGHTVTDEQAAGKTLRLHPVFLAPNAADKRATQASFDPATGSYSIPPRTAVVFVED